MTSFPLSSSSPLTPFEKEQLRKSASLVFRMLEDASHRAQNEDPTRIPSWIRPSYETESGGNSADIENTRSWRQNRTTRCHYFDMYGFSVQRQFCSPEQVAELKEEMKRLVENNWNPGKAGGEGDSNDEETEPDYAFATDAKSNTQRGDYFLDSADKVSYFAEPQALDESSGKLKEEYHHDKLAALNKAGHGMHTMPGSAFSNYTLSYKLCTLVQELGWQHPVIPQSMYIFKQPSIGGTVHSHQDSTFLYTTPKQSCLGLWLALDDATLDNGCLWVRPQSHFEPVRRQFIRNPEYHKTDASDATKEESFETTTNNTPKLIFEERNPTPTNVTWEGSLPESVQVLSTLPEDKNTDSNELFDSFVPVEVKAGDLVVFCGTLDHFSLPNFSKLPRHTFQLHLVEGPNAQVEWSPLNWLQYPPNKSFLELSICQ
ncbi:phytanoyl-CoA dioxygenase family protein [Nitzschia inconspicua]|uniref:Phytanoyl-CoA dioxygenase family protein n=1 Tax=Nitzschia inconspicua TaxID=303405 RepID=A0A9K3L5P9_9STRA|nr:phytanoyl-CoA dioxygenase family protein [Nitzschia inconspicua]